MCFCSWMHVQYGYVIGDSMVSSKLCSEVFVEMFQSGVKTGIHLENV